MLIGGLHGDIPRTGGDPWPSPCYGQSTLSHLRSSWALPKSTSPARNYRKVGLDKQCLLMEVRIAPVHYYSADAFCFARRTGRAVNTMLARSILRGGIYLGTRRAH